MTRNISEALLSPEEFDGITSGALPDKSRAITGIKELDFKRLVENAPDPILVLDPDGSVRYANSAMEKLTGFARDRILNVKYPYPWCPDDNDAKCAESPVSYHQKGLSRWEARLRKQNGEPFWVEINLIPVKIRERTRYIISCWKDITEQKALKQQVVFYMQQVTLVQEEEKKRLARELHDDTAQTLALLSIELDSLTHSIDSLSEKTARKIGHLKMTVDHALENVRRFSHELRPAILDQLGLLAALEFLVDEMNQHGYINAKLTVAGRERRLPGDVELALFRIVQEALSNIRKHSEATRAAVSIKFTPGYIHIKVSDNGKGFDVEEDLTSAVSRGRLGLISIKERAKLIDAELVLKSNLGEGTQIAVKLGFKPQN